MKLLLPIALLATGLAMTAWAQETPETMLPKFSEVDENEDGKIDAAEAKALSEALVEEDSAVRFDFTIADANEDGAVDAAEYAKYQDELNS